MSAFPKPGKGVDRCERKRKHDAAAKAFRDAVWRRDGKTIHGGQQVGIVGATTPDLTFILDLPPETGLARAAARRQIGGYVDRFEAEEIDFHRALRDAFLDIAARHPHRCCVIDAARPVAEVSRTIRDLIAARLVDGVRRMAAQ